MSTTHRTSTTSSQTKQSVPQHVLWHSSDDNSVEEEISEIFNAFRDKLKPVVEYQRNKLGVFAPRFVYISSDFAASWRRILTRNIIFLQKELPNVGDEDDDLYYKMEDLELCFQKHINAVNCVLTGFFELKETHKGADLMDVIDNIVFSDRAQYSEQQNLLNTHNAVRQEYISIYGYPSNRE